MTGSNDRESSTGSSENRSRLRLKLGEQCSTRGRGKRKMEFFFRVGASAIDVGAMDVHAIAALEFKAGIGPHAGGVDAEGIVLALWFLRNRFGGLGKDA